MYKLFKIFPDLILSLNVGLISINVFCSQKFSNQKMFIINEIRK